MRILMLNLTAPLMSFGDVRVDNHGVIAPFPGRSLICGLLANALGYRHGDTNDLQALQDRLQIASRCDRTGREMMDYQTVDLGDHGGPHQHPNGTAHAAGSAKPLMAISKQGRGCGDGWTTRGHPESREGGPDARYGTHIRYQHYHADRVQAVAAVVADGDGPDCDQLASALQHPVRPLFIGRKTCLPAEPILAGTTEADRLLDALIAWPRHPRADTGALNAWWPASEGDGPGPSRELPTTDRRDWRTQLVVGRRLLHHGLIDPPPAPETEAVA